MKITKLHRTLEFKQEPWMAPYIKMNTELRKQANSDFEKDFFKLTNNSVFGKTMENLRKRINVHLVKGVNEIDKLKKLVAKPSFNAFKMFNENLVAVHMYKDQLTLNRPIYVGMSILDLSKHLMYDFYYNSLKSSIQVVIFFILILIHLFYMLKLMMFTKTLKITKASMIQVIITTSISCLATRIKKSWESLKMNLVEFQLVNTLGLDQRCTLLSQKKKKLEKQKA